MPASERPFCFGKEYLRASTACLGGLDLDYVDEEGTNLRPPCSVAHACRDAMGTNKPTPLPWTDMVIPQHAMRRLNIDGPPPGSPNFIPPERSSMYRQSAPTPATAQSTIPFLIESAMPAQPAPKPVVTPPPPMKALPQPGTTEFDAMIERLNAAGKRADEQAALRAQQISPPPPVAPAPAPVAMPAPAPVRPVMPPMQQQVQQQAPPAPRPSFLERVARPAAAIVNAAAPLPPPLTPQQVPQSPQAVQYPAQVYGAAPTYQLNYGLPGYLTAAEPRHPGESLWSVLGREVIRAIGKAIGHAFAHFFDTRVLRPA